MLTGVLLSLLILIIVAVLVSLITTPIIVHLIKWMTFTIRPVYYSDNSKRKVYPPNHIHNIGCDSVDGKKMYRNPITDLGDKYRYEGRYNRTETSMFKQPNTTSPNKLSEVFHRIILFYRSYYGHSTKVEKNLQIGSVYSWLIIQTVIDRRVENVCINC